VIAYVTSAVVVARGMRGPIETCPVLARGEAYDGAAPDPASQPQILDPRERRRTTPTVRLALEAADLCVAACGFARDTLPAVFASAFGDGPLLGSLLETLATPNARVSPTKFHNSVHNAALGYWSIATRCREGCTSIAASDCTAGAALLRSLVETTIDARPVLLVAYDCPFDPPLAAVRPVAAPFAAALVLQPRSDRAICRLEVVPTSAATPPTPPANSSLRELWATNPSARLIPLLEAVAGRRQATIDIAHDDDGVLRATVMPC
jgi:hypothetical protein